MDVLTGLKRADAAIVGGGLTGLLLGASLAHEGMKVALVEAGDGTLTLPREAACLPAPSLLAKVEAIHGTQAAQQFSLALLAQLHALLAAPLPYVQRMPLYTYARTRAALPALEAMQALYTRLNLPVHTAPDAGGCPFPVELSLLTPDQALLDMPRWTAALAGSIRRRGGQIFLNSRVTGFEGHRIFTAAGCIHAPVTVLTTGVPLGAHFETLFECRSLVHCILDGSAPLHSLQRPIQADGPAICPTPSGLIATLDGGRCGTRQQQARLPHASAMLQQFLPDWQQGSTHFTRTAVTLDGLPLIGMLPGSRQLCAAGVDGILGAMHAAQVLTRHILGHSLPEDALYSPLRHLPQALLRQAKQRAARIKLANSCRLSAPSCTHCGCRMRYITPVSSWVCPLCSSACTMLGQPIEGPGSAPVTVSPRQRPY